MAVAWPWSGGNTEEGAVVAAKLTAPATCRLVASTAPDLSNPVFSAAVDADAQRYVKLSVAGLAPLTQHHYGLELNGVLDPIRGKFRTFPVPGVPTSFSVSIMGDEYHKSNHRVYDHIRVWDGGAAPLLFNLHLGDFGYPDPGANDPALFRTNYEAVMGLSRCAQLFRENSIAYVTSDHDAGPNDCDRTSPSIPAMQAAYRQVVPTHPLAVGAVGPIYRAFTVGRVRFLITDGRSARDPNLQVDTAAKTMLGAVQVQWLKDELSVAHADPNVALIVWGNDSPWIADAGVVDSWGLYAFERRSIADHIKAEGVNELVMLVADTHATMFDDGRNSGYATGGGGSFPVIHTAGLDCLLNGRGGPYSSGPFKPGTGVYGRLTVEDDGGPILLRWRAMSVDPATGVGSEVMSFQHRPAGWPQVHAVGV